MAANRSSMKICSMFRMMQRCRKGTALTHSIPFFVSYMNTQFLLIGQTYGTYCTLFQNWLGQNVSFTHRCYSQMCISQSIGFNSKNRKKTTIVKKDNKTDLCLPQKPSDFVACKNNNK